MTQIFVRILFFAGWTHDTHMYRTIRGESRPQPPSCYPYLESAFEPAQLWSPESADMTGIDGRCIFGYMENTPESLLSLAPLKFKNPLDPVFAKNRTHYKRGLTTWSAGMGVLISQSNFPFIFGPIKILKSTGPCFRQKPDPL